MIKSKYIKIKMQQNMKFGTGFKPNHGSNNKYLPSPNS